MAYNVISSFIWGTKPKIPMSISYDRKRVNADMQYRIKVVVSPVNGESYFGYPIYLGIKLDNVSKVSEYTLKTAYPSTWNSNITYESAWITLSNKTTGTTALSVNIYSGLGSVRNATYNYDLVVDPCISLMNVSNGTLGTAQTISVTRYNSTFKHTIEYSCGSASGTIAEKSTSTSISWNPSVDLAQQNTTGSSVSITLKITTFNGSVTIGSSEKTIICAIPNSVVPTISGITATENVSGIATKFGSFVQWKSKLNVSVSSAGSQGSTIKSITTTICGVDYSGASFVSEALTESGSVNIVTKVTDSRERSATLTKTITVSAYTSPVIESLEVYRIDSSGNPDDEGSGIAIKTKYSIAPVGNKNTHAYGIEYKLPSSDSFTSLGTGTAGYTTDTTYSLPTASISPDNAYIIRFRIQDYFNTVYYSFELPTAYTTFDVNASGKGFAFGKVSQKDALEIAMPAEFQDSIKIGEDVVADFVIESGYDSATTFYYRKYSSGMCEAWAKFTVTPTTYTGIGSDYYTEMIYHSLPFNIYNGIITAVNGRQYGLIIACNVSNTQAYYRVLRSAKPADGTSYTVYLRVDGYWKTV